MVCVKARESKIRQADFKKLIANASAAYVIYQKIDGQIVPIAATNALAEMMLGAGSTADDYLKVVGTPVAFGQVDEVDRPRFIDKVNEFCQNGGVLDVVYRRKLFGSDTCHVVHARGQIKHLDDGTEYAVIYFEDVNARKENTYTSTVTELPDMSYLLTFGGVEVRRILAQGGTPALAYFDIKGMKAFNAAFGFEEGDELLKQVGRGLQKCYSGCTVCRVSDDRFTVIGDLDEIRAKLAKGEAAQLVSKLGENIATTLKCGYAPIEDEGTWRRRATARVRPASRSETMRSCASSGTVPRWIARTCSPAMSGSLLTTPSTRGGFSRSSSPSCARSQARLAASRPSRAGTTPCSAPSRRACSCPRSKRRSSSRSSTVIS